MALCPQDTLHRSCLPAELELSQLQAGGWTGWLGGLPPWGRALAIHLGPVDQPPMQTRRAVLGRPLGQRTEGFLPAAWKWL